MAPMVKVVQETFKCEEDWGWGPLRFSNLHKNSPHSRKSPRQGKLHRGAGPEPRGSNKERSWRKAWGALRSSPRTIRKVPQPRLFQKNVNKFSGPGLLRVRAIGSPTPAPAFESQVCPSLGPSSLRESSPLAES